MRGKKKKSIEELETELEQLIANSGRSKDDIHTDYIAYQALKRRIDNPDSLHEDDDIRRMKDLHNVYLLGRSIRSRQNKINAAHKVAAAFAAAIATSNDMNTSISTSASTSINGNEITASFESTPPPSSDPSTTSSLPSSNDETSRASLDINSLSDQSSILASRSINEITASFEANASFALSTSRSNASDSSMVGAQQLSKRPRLASQQSDDVVVVDLSNEIWNPHARLLSSNVTIMDVPRDGNCLFYACISKLQNCSTFTIEQASNMRNNIMDYLLRHASDPSVPGDLGSLTWNDLAMLHASGIETELRPKPFSRNAIVSTLAHYAHYMRFADIHRCLYGNQPEVLLISSSYALNIAVYQVDPRSSQYYELRQGLYGNPNNSENVVYLLYNGSHYQRIITDDRRYSVIDDTLTEIDVSIAMDLSCQDDFSIGPIDVEEEESLSITEELTSNSSYCQVCNDDSNSLTCLESISQESFNFAHEVSYENVSDEASVAHATIQEATNDPIINDSALLARE